MGDFPHVPHFAPDGAWISEESTKNYKYFALIGLTPAYAGVRSFRTTGIQYVILSEAKNLRKCKTIT